MDRRIVLFLSLATFTTACGDDSQSREPTAAYGAECDDDVTCEAVNGDQRSAAEALANARAAYQQREADLAYHLGTFGATLTDAQRAAFIEDYWALEGPAADAAAVPEAADSLHAALTEFSPHTLLQEYRVGAESADLIFYLDGLQALADTEYAEDVIQWIGDLREYQDDRFVGAELLESGLLGDGYDETWQQAVAAVAVETLFSRDIVEGAAWVESPTDPAVALDKYTALFGRAAFFGWGTSNVVDAASAAWRNASSARPAAVVREMRRYVNASSGTGPVARSFGTMGAVACMLPLGIDLATGSYPESTYDALKILQSMTFTVSGLRQGLQPMILRIGEQSRWVRAANAAAGTRVFGLFGSALTLGLDAYSYATNEDPNAYDHLVMLGSIISAGGAIAGAAGQVQISVVAAALAGPLKITAGYFAEQQRYIELRERLFDQSYDLLQGIGVSSVAAQTLASAHPDAVQILAGTASPSEFIVGLDANAIQRLAETNAEMFLDGAVHRREASTSRNADDRALIGAAIVSAGIVDPDQLADVLRSMPVPAQDAGGPFNSNVELALTFLHNYKGPEAIVYSPRPFEEMRSVLDFASSTAEKEAVETFIDLLESAAS